MTRQEIFAKAFCQAIVEMANSENALANFESYLSQHFEKWVKKYANDMEGLTYELESFAQIR